MWPSYKVCLCCTSCLSYNKSSVDLCCQILPMMGTRVRVQSNLALLWMLLASPILQYRLTSLSVFARPLNNSSELFRSLNILCRHFIYDFIVYISVLFDESFKSNQAIRDKWTRDKHKRLNEQLILEISTFSRRSFPLLIYSQLE